jgi:Golgi SNAP receptor complex protein 1
VLNDFCFCAVQMMNFLIRLCHVVPIFFFFFFFLFFWSFLFSQSASFTQETLLSVSDNAATENASSTMAIEIVDLLRELTEINERISASLSEADRKHSTAALHAQQHHKGRLREYEKDFRTIKSNIEQAKAQAELLSTVRKDISAFKEGGNGRAGEDVRVALDGAGDELGRVLGAASSNRAALQHQRSVVDQAVTKLKSAAALLPGLNGLMNRIRRRKARDMIILACVSAFFVVFLYLYASRGGK